MVRVHASHRVCMAVLLATFVVLYGPYVFTGGFVRDDIGMLIFKRPASFLEYQWRQSSFLTMTARPLSALLHGLCYWYLDRAYWAHHALNLALLGLSVALVYLSVRALFSQQLAFLTALFAIVYPCAGGTSFSAIMMNSNLAAVLWMAALYTSTQSRSTRGRLLTSFFLLLSLLSYEAFAPSSLLLVLLALRDDPELPLRTRLWRRAWPVLGAFALFALYRGLIERLIFHNAFSRAAWPGWLGLLKRLLVSHAKGVKVALVDALMISARSLRNVVLFSPLYALALVALLGLVCWAIARCLRDAPQEDAEHSPSLVTAWLKRATGWSLPALPMLDRLLLALASFSLAHWIFVFSGYMPDAKGFENRTQGAIRFAVAFMLAVALMAAWQWASQRRARLLLLGATCLLTCASTLSIAAQRKAWSLAAVYNDQVADELVTALRRADLAQRPAIRLLADIPETFPGQVNHEPNFGAPWDLVPALMMRLPGVAIEANTLKPVLAHDGAPRMQVSDKEVTIDGWSHTPYPFHLYRAADRSLRLISSADDFRAASGQGAQISFVGRPRQ